jgi:hypothetical protein
MENNQDLEIQRKKALSLIEEWERLETKDTRTDSEISNKENKIKQEKI